MANPWFRAYSEMVDDEKLRLLAFEDRWHFVALLCCKNNGILESNDSLMRRKVAVKLGLDTRELDEVARRLSEVGLIDQNTLQPLKWAERQFQSDSSKERVRKYRERMKNQGVPNDERYSNVTVTAQDKEEDKEEDKDITKKIKKPLTEFPSNFEVTVEMFEWAVDVGVPDGMIKLETQKFKDYCLSKGAKYKDWLATWRNWMRNSVGYNNYKKIA